MAKPVLYAAAGYRCVLFTGRVPVHLPYKVLTYVFLSFAEMIQRFRNGEKSMAVCHVFFVFCREILVEIAYDRMSGTSPGNHAVALRAACMVFCIILCLVWRFEKAKGMIFNQIGWMNLAKEDGR